MMNTRIYWICDNIFKIIYFLYAEENGEINSMLNEFNMINIVLNQIM